MVENAYFLFCVRTGIICFVDMLFHFSVQVFQINAEADPGFCKWGWGWAGIGVVTALGVVTAKHGDQLYFINQHIHEEYPLYGAIWGGGQAFYRRHALVEPPVRLYIN